MKKYITPEAQAVAVLTKDIITLSAAASGDGDDVSITLNY